MRRLVGAGVEAEGVGEGHAVRVGDWEGLEAAVPEFGELAEGGGAVHAEVGDDLPSIKKTKESGVLDKYTGKQRNISMERTDEIAVNIFFDIIDEAKSSNYEVGDEAIADAFFERVCRSNSLTEDEKSYILDKKRHDKHLKTPANT